MTNPRPRQAGHVTGFVEGKVRSCADRGISEQSIEPSHGDDVINHIDQGVAAGVLLAGVGLGAEGRAAGVGLGAEGRAAGVGLATEGLSAGVALGTGEDLGVALGLAVAGDAAVDGVGDPAETGLWTFTLDKPMNCH